MPDSAIDAWKRFRDRLQLANERLVQGVTAAAEDICGSIDGLRERLASVADDALEPGSVASFEKLFGERENRLFSEPIGTCEKQGPIRRSLSAIELHELQWSDLARGLPTEIAISGAGLMEMIGPDARQAWQRPWLKWRKSPRPLALRAIVDARLRQLLDRRASIDGEFQLVLARTELHLVAAWQLYRRHQLARLAHSSGEKAALGEEQEWWSRTGDVLATRTRRFVEAYRRWSETSLATLGAAVVRRSAGYGARRQGKSSERWQEHISLWRRQERGVHAVFDLERQLSALARGATQSAGDSLESLRAEHVDVYSELERAVMWLEVGVERRNHESFPPPKANLLSAEQRARDWTDRVSAVIQLHVPAFVEAVRPVRRTRRVRRKLWRQLHPRRVLENALQHDGLAAARNGFREAETEHTAIVRDIEQARQVVTFALEVGREEGQTSQALPHEAATNALALLRHRKEILIDPQVSAELGLCDAEALTLLEAHTALERGRLGLFALLTRQGGPRAAQNLGRAALHAVRVGSRATWTVLGKVFQWTAWKLGLERPVAPHQEAVVERPRLSAILEAQLRTRELPALYQRLFRLAPVEDQRFLVGREVEMRGLSQAFSMWQSGRSVTVLVVGARGSGKTSLLNCASAALFPGVPVVRGQFGERIVSSQQMSAVLRPLFGISEASDLAAALNRERRVAVIEEFERTFLRRMNGFDALRDFLRLLAATSRSTLWIISMNQACFGYLDAVLDIGRNFSHCINATTVSQEQMTEAILQRHTLSGMRLQFAPSPPEDPRAKRLRRFFGLELTPQQLFFDALFRQSEGLFRSAFELWLGSIERIEGAVLHMLQPLDPSYGRLLETLKLDDLFTLQAILQHASLTAEELAEVFSTSLEEAACRLERLRTLEILEAEPMVSGLRVRPQAGRLVRDALSQQNLL